MFIHLFSSHRLPAVCVFGLTWLLHSPLSAWTITYWHDLSNTTSGRYWSLNGGTPSTTMQYLQVPNLSTGPTIYFCLEHLAIPSNRISLSGPMNIHVHTRQYNITNEIADTRAFAGWSKIANSLTSTFPNYSSSWPAGNYGIIAPASPYGGRVYSTGHRVYGWFSGKVGSNPNYLSLNWTTLADGSGNVGSVKITLSDQNLYQLWEPDVVAQPVTTALGEPSISINGQQDKVSLGAPASYSLTWTVPGATSFSVSGGTGAGAISPALSSGTSKAFSNVPTSLQTYTLATQANAALSWRMSSNASWAITRAGTTVASGTNNVPSFSTAQEGTYILKVNGIEKTDEDEVIQLTPGFFRRSKTIEAKIGNP